MVRSPVVLALALLALGARGKTPSAPRPGVDWPGFRGIQARGVSEGAATPTAWNVPAMLAAVPYQSPLWRLRYPELYRLVQDDPEEPKRNDITRCVSVGATNWMVLQDGMQVVTNKRRPYNYYSYFNSVTLGDPGFTNMANGEVENG